MFPPKDMRKNFSVYEGSISEIAKMLAKNILSPPEYIEPSTEYIIKTLQEAATYITAALRYLSGKEIEDLFGGKQIFENILPYEENKQPTESLRLASAYLLINQILFHHVLAAKMPSKFPELDPDKLKKPAELNVYFAKVLEVNYRTVFSYDVASRIPSGFIEQVKTVVSVIIGLAPEKVGGDLLGTIFHNLMPFDIRKSVAAFYTNVLAAELLAWLAIDEPQAKVADFSVGSGGLLVSSYRRKRFLIENNGKPFSHEDHKNFISQDLLGIDVMPFAASVAACHLALQTPEYFTDKVNIAIWDSTELNPNQIIPSIASLDFVMKGQTFIEAFAQKPKKRKKGVVSMTGEAPREIKLQRYDVAIMNPPFTRQERLPAAYKNLLNQRFGEYKKYIKGQMGFFGYFALLADKFLKNNGKVALVLPATALHTRSSQGIRDMWAKNYHVEYLISTWHRLAFSESVVFREILLIAKKGTPIKNATTKICVLKKLPNKISAARELADKLRSIKEDYEDDDIIIRNHSFLDLSVDTSDWNKFISLSDLKLIDFLETLLMSEKLVALSSITPSRENDLRHYKFKNFHGFILNKAERAERLSDIWAIDRIKNDILSVSHIDRGQKIEIPKTHLRKALRRFSNFRTINIGKNSDYLIVKPFKELDEMASSVLAVNELKKFTANVVKSWEERFDRNKAHLLIARRLWLASIGTCLIAFYSDIPTVGIDLWSLTKLDKDSAKILALWLNSSFSILQLLYIGVACEGPWMKLHGYMMERLLVPDPTKLSADEKKRALELFDKIEFCQFPSIIAQLSSNYCDRQLIDKFWLEVLGCDSISDESLTNYYASLCKEIVAIGKLISGKTKT